MKEIPVVFATDDTYTSYLSVAIESIIEHCTSKISIFVLHVGLSEENKYFLKQQVENSANLRIQFIECSHLISLDKLDNGGVLYLTSIAWLRLLIPYIFTQYSKVIYLDVDLIVKADLAYLYEEDVTGYLLGASRDTFIVSWNNEKAVRSQLKSPENYFNSGVLLINCAEFRERYTINQLIDKAYIADYFYADQDFLNLLCDDGYKTLSSKWNMLKGYLSKDTPEWLKKEYEEASKEPYIIHYVNKPMKEMMTSDLTLLFLEYASRVKVPLVQKLFINNYKAGTFAYTPTIRDYILHLIDEKSEKMDARFIVKCLLMKIKTYFLK